jgi:hypothetical protein
MSDNPWAPFSQSVTKQKKLTPACLLLSEGLDKGTPLLLGDGTPLELGEQYE